MGTEHAYWYPGHAHGLVWPHGFALIEDSVAPTAADDVWEQTPTTPGDFVAAIQRATGASLTDLPGFAVAFGHGSQWRIAVSGNQRVSAARPDEVVVITHEGPRWTERQVDRVDRIGLMLGDHAVSAGAQGRPIVAGVVPAAALLRNVHLSSRAHQPTAAATPAPPPSPSRPVPSQPASSQPATSNPVPVPPTPAPPAARHTPIAPAAEQAPPTPAAPPAASAAPAEQTSGPAIPGSFSHLWDATMLGANGPEPAAGHQASRLGDHDDLTVMGEGSIEPAPLPPPTPIGGGQVLARVCAQGHPNPPERATCRVCDIDLAGAPQQIPQPIVGRAVLASREVIELDRPVVFGREPQSKRGTTDGATARLVALAGNHISRNQVRLSPEGWQVYAVELRSKNGTLLHRFGEAPMRLPERPLLLKNHDVLDLGHGVLITLEGLP